MVNTPIGEIVAYDCNALGMNADINSLNFYESGQVKSLKTSTDIVDISDQNGDVTTIKPGLKPHLFNNEIELTNLTVLENLEFASVIAKKTWFVEY
ncbi:MAG: hypothetical protein ACOCRL_01375 [Bacillota bacterium]